MKRLIFFFVFASLAITTEAQTILQVNTPVIGEIRSAGSTQSWTFNAVREAVYSFYVEGQGGFDPVLTIEFENGTVVISNDDAIYQRERDALLEAITMPQSGAYQVIVGGYGNATGEFTLTILPGYADVVLENGFNTWESGNQELNLETDADQMTLNLEGIQQSGHVYADVRLDDFYAETRFTAVQNRNSWSAGLVLRRQSTADYYSVLLSSEGVWRFLVIEDGQERVIRDWTPHPAIVAGQVDVTFGVLAHNAGFDIFYNNQFVGSVVDDTIADPGAVGVVIATANALDSQVNMTFADFIVTAPVSIFNQSVFPQELVRGSGSIVVQELERRRLIPAGGQMVLNVAEGFRESRSPGVQLQPLASGTLFDNLAMSSTVTLEITNDEAISACGVYIRSEDAENYMVAYLDNRGSYGVSQRRGDTFEAGLYVEDTTWDVAEPNELLIVVNEDRLFYYINGRYAGDLEIEPVEGSVGNVVVNFDPVDAVCRFADTWLWRW